MIIYQLLHDMCCNLSVWSNVRLLLIWNLLWLWEFITLTWWVKGAGSKITVVEMTGLWSWMPVDRFAWWHFFIAQLSASLDGLDVVVGLDVTSSNTTVSCSGPWCWASLSVAGGWVWGWSFASFTTMLWGWAGASSGTDLASTSAWFWALTEASESTPLTVDWALFECAGSGFTFSSKFFTVGTSTLWKWVVTGSFTHLTSFSAIFVAFSPFWPVSVSAVDILVVVRVGILLDGIDVFVRCWSNTFVTSSSWACFTFLEISFDTLGRLGRLGQAGDNSGSVFSSETFTVESDGKESVFQGFGFFSAFASQAVDVVVVLSPADQSAFWHVFFCCFTSVQDHVR